MANVFISYSRKDKEFVQRLHEALQKRDLDTWVDWEGIPPTADWLQEIYTAIEASDTFVAVLSPDSARSEVCKLEVERAARHNKRIVPVVCRDVDPREVPPELARHNWLFLRATDPFEEGIDTLITAINTDFDWVRAHTRILVKGSEWESKGRDSSFLLRGAELREAEAWLSKAGAEKSPGPTALHARYILASRKAERGRLRLLSGTAIAGMAVAILLAIFALSERNQAVQETHVRATAEAISETRRLEAERQQKIATSRQLAAQSLSRINAQLDLSLLLSVEANREADTVEARSSLLEGLQLSPHLNTILQGGEAELQSIAASPSVVATGDISGTISLWDPGTGEQMSQPMRNENYPIGSLAFSPDGKILASGNSEGTLTLWSIDTHEALGPPSKGDYGSTQKLMFSPDGKTLAAFGSGREVTVWNIEAKPIAGTVHTVQAPVLALGFTPESKLVAAAAWDRGIVIWDVLADAPIGVPLVGHETSVLGAAFSPDATHLAATDSNNLIIWDLATRQPAIKPVILQNGTASRLAYNHAGTMLATANRDNTITLWDVVTGEPVDTPLTGHTNFVTGLTFAGVADHTLISISNDKTIVWSVAKTQSLSQSFTQVVSSNGVTTTDGIYSVTFPKGDNSTIASGDGDNGVTLWDVSSRTNKASLLVHPGQSGWVRSVAYSPDNAYLVAGSEDSTITLQDLRTNREYTLAGHKGGVLDVAFSPDGKLIASASRDKTVILWDANTRKPVGSPLKGHNAVVTSVAFSPDGKLLASSSWDKTVILWDVATQKEIGTPLKGHTDYVWSVVFSPDGKLLASAGENRNIILWDVATRKPLGQPLTGHSGTINSLAFSPDGSLLASGSDDGTIGLWDVATRLQITPFLPGGSIGVLGVAFSPDGTKLATGGGATPTIWDVSPASWEEHACRIAARNMTHAEWQRYMGDTPYRKTCPALP